MRRKDNSAIMVEYGEAIKVTSKSECRNVVEKGKIISSFFYKDTLEMDSSHSEVRVLYKDYVYNVNMHFTHHTCYYKRKFHNK